jgi:hypothetical protein
MPPSTARSGPRARDLSLPTSALVNGGVAFDPLAQRRAAGGLTGLFGSDETLRRFLT